MDFTIIIVIVVLIAILLTYLIVVSASKQKEGKRTPNYRALFIIGISWLPIGIATDNTAFWSIGLVFLIIGLANKNKWKQETKWSDLPPNVKRFKLTLISVLIIFLVIVFSYLMFKGN